MSNGLNASKTINSRPFPCSGEGRSINGGWRGEGCFIIQSQLHTVKAINSYTTDFFRIKYQCLCLARCRISSRVVSFCLFAYIKI